MIGWLARLFRKPDETDDDDTFPDSDGWTDRIPLDSDCPDTQPTAPGLLDSLESVMKTTILAVVILMLTGCATLKGVEISDEDRVMCEREGCTVWSRSELVQLINEAMRRGYLAAQKQKGSI
jgi:hypothetical protein